MGILDTHVESCREEVRILPRKLKAAFAAGCAQRQTLAYTAYAKRTSKPKPQRLAELTDLLWNALLVDMPSRRELRALSGECHQLIPSPDVIDDMCRVSAEYAVTTLAYAIRTLSSGETSDAIWAANGALESLHAYLTSPIGGRHPPYDVRNPDEIERVQSDPLLQAEYKRQRRDLAELAAIEKNVERWATFLCEYKTRSQAEAKDFLKAVL